MNKLTLFNELKQGDLFTYDDKPLRILCKVGDTHARDRFGIVCETNPYVLIIPLKG